MPKAVIFRALHKHHYWSILDFKCKGLDKRYGRIHPFYKGEKNIDQWPEFKKLISLDTLISVLPRSRAVTPSKPATS